MLVVSGGMLKRQQFSLSALANVSKIVENLN